jgi:hypothetical protein
LILELLKEPTTMSHLDLYPEWIDLLIESCSDPSTPIRVLHVAIVDRQWIRGIGYIPKCMPLIGRVASNQDGCVVRYVLSLALVKVKVN